MENAFINCFRLLKIDKNEKEYSFIYCNENNPH